VWKGVADKAKQKNEKDRLNSNKMAGENTQVLNLRVKNKRKILGRFQMICSFVYFINYFQSQKNIVITLGDDKGGGEGYADNKG
jgi:hypothetical protein